jgi:uncharacterized protein YkwD
VPGSTLTDPPPSRPDLYAGARRRFSGLGTIAAGFVTLVLVLGALLTSELDRYSSPDTALDAQATGAAPPPTVDAAPPSQGGPASTPTPEATPSSPPPPPPPSPRATAAANEVNTLVAATINRQLDALGCKRVKIEPTLVTAAKQHMTTMVRSGYLSTVAPDGSKPATRAKSAGYTGKRVIESIVLGAETAPEAARLAFPLPADSADALPITVQVVSRTPLKCGYTAIGADFRRDSRNVPIWSLILGATR